METERLTRVRAVGGVVRKEVGGLPVGDARHDVALHVSHDGGPRFPLRRHLRRQLGRQVPRVDLRHVATAETPFHSLRGGPVIFARPCISGCLSDTTNISSDSSL